VTVMQDPALQRLLGDLHARSDAQIAALRELEARREGPNPPDRRELKQLLSDKFVALDRDKAEFCYQLCRAINARRVVEVGTSYGVSTLYLAAAVRDNIGGSGGHGIVIGTEYEPHKAAAARASFQQAGLSPFIELREGDLRETLRTLEGPVDFLLVDIWVSIARTALELVAPRLRPGAIVICDNTELHRADYADYFAFLNDPANGFATMTLPFQGGLEFSIRQAGRG
jgi:predicted O-methyltransferase YrrM